MTSISNAKKPKACIRCFEQIVEGAIQTVEVGQSAYRMGDKTRPEKFYSHGLCALNQGGSNGGPVELWDGFTRMNAELRQAFVAISEMRDEYVPEQDPIKIALGVAKYQRYF